MGEELLSEGSAKFYAPKQKVVSKDMSVFYNPAMKLNRDITVAVLSALGRKGMVGCDLLAASGVRTIRLAKELPEGTFSRIYTNDVSKEAAELIRKNLEINRVEFEDWNGWEERIEGAKFKVILCNMEANRLLNESPGFDYIDIDPFGSPNQFLDSAIRRISRGGIIAVTATDTAPLSGTYQDTCLRKYWARPFRNSFMHETGLRILIRKVQLVGAQYGRALIPIFSYYNMHYFRVFFKCEKSKELADKSLKEHGYLLHCTKCLSTKKAETIFNERRCSCGGEFLEIGPLYLGKLWDEHLLSKISTDEKIVSTIRNESKLDVPFFYLVGEICKKNSLCAPKKVDIIKELELMGFRASETHFHPEGIRTEANPEKVAEAIKQISNNRNRN